jgi:ectoine hydroxylase
MSGPNPGIDRYPTRVSTRPSVMPREDPVVWGDGRRGPMTSTEVQRFEAMGYLPVDELLDRDVLVSLYAELRRILHDADPSDERVVLERHGTAVRSVFEVHRTSPVFAELAAHPALADRARQLLGSDVYVHQSRVNLKPGFRGEGFYWHSDFETWHAEDGMPAMRAVSVSIALRRNEPWNGGLLVIPGSHHRFIGCAGETPADHYRRSLRAQETGVPNEAEIAGLVTDGGIDMICGPAGSAVFFDCNLMHGSNGNITPHPRVNLFVVYNSIENTLVEPFAAPAPRPSFVASRDVEPLP